MHTYEVKLTIVARSAKALAEFRAELEENSKPEEDTGQPECITYTRIDEINEIGGET